MQFDQELRRGMNTRSGSAADLAHVEDIIRLSLFQDQLKQLRDAQSLSSDRGIVLSVLIVEFWWDLEIQVLADTIGGLLKELKLFSHLPLH